MVNFVRSFLKDETGASAAEYALILAIVGTGIATAAWTLGDNIKGAMTTAATCISATNAKPAANC
ncbi:Flp family type IVb pilin [Sphingobium estronivorans]|uniref:Flp family type IVb pilin n=1 Tax=Sphingobium estronivorans TaxID=1577690 RepID=UPI00123C068A|nr:Flp family type IVb pilin [Sphingobium estronivorans]